MITFPKLGKMGRLGNQLWQIASTAGIAATLGQPFGFYRWDYRPFFNVPDEFFPSNMQSRPWPVVDATTTEPVQHLPFPEARPYLQDYNLFRDIEPQVREWFRPSEFALQRIREHPWFINLPRPILSVHVRLGDNYQQPNNCHPIRPWSYYRDAIMALDNEFESIVVFSDNPQVAMAHLGDLEEFWPIYEFNHSRPRKKEHERGYATDPFDDWVDLVAMTFCDLHIVSNSTYAWWGAFLSGNRRPIYPWPWFGPDLHMINASLMFPEGWVRWDHGPLPTV